MATVGLPAAPWERQPTKSGQKEAGIDIRYFMSLDFRKRRLPKNTNLIGKSRPVARHGLDHECLTYRFGGRDYRLTDVHGNVVKQILA